MRVRVRLRTYWGHRPDCGLTCSSTVRATTYESSLNRALGGSFLTITVIGATGRAGSAVAQRLVTANAAVRVLVRDPGKAQRLFGDSPFLEIIRIRLDNPAAVSAGLTGSDAVFLAMGSR